ncbi:MAG TPA: hypothetical protein VMV19_03605 [Xanthobacteraceae bacterium]|nr:hypothetical protein [Xanthobacteraceae bacterium]
MYLIAVILLLLILPAGSVAIEDLAQGGHADLLHLVGKWFVFWAAGVRLFIAGWRQIGWPRLTAEDIFALKDPAAYPVVREVGFGNLAMGWLGLLTLPFASFLIPSASVGGLYYGLAGLGHAFRQRNAEGQIAMISDFLIFAVFAVFVALRGF